MCYQHVLTQDPERLLEEDVSDQQEQRAEEAPERPEPLPEPDPCEPLSVTA